MRRWIVLLLILGGLGSALGRLAWQRARGVEVRTARVARGRVVEAVYATGRLDTDRRATVRARRAAPLTAVLVGPGEAVRAGQVVARQDETESRLAVERAESELAAARAALAEAYDAAARAEQLHRAGLLPENEWVRQRERASELGRRTEALAAAAALAREQASWTHLRSPLDGAVAALLRRTGDVLREGDEVLTVVDLSTAYLRVAVDERDLGRIRPGLPARVVFDAYPDVVVEGSVWRVVPAVDRLTKSADVLVALPPDTPPLQLDLTATVNLIVSVVEDALVLPREALAGVGTTRQVLHIDQNRRAVAHPVQVGLCDAERCQLLAGLAEGDEVIVAPTALPAGTKVYRR
jgi:RND family efflux transporter MFP subunit